MKPQNDLNSFARSDNLDIVEAFQIKEMPVSGDYQCGTVFRGKPWQLKGWVIPPEQNDSFVANMEMVLDIYKRPFDPL